jgi:hypothetical protein
MSKHNHDGVPSSIIELLKRLGGAGPSFDYTKPYTEYGLTFDPSECASCMRPKLAEEMEHYRCDSCYKRMIYTDDKSELIALFTPRGSKEFRAIFEKLPMHMVEFLAMRRYRFVSVPVQEAPKEDGEAENCLGCGYAHVNDGCVDARAEPRIVFCATEKPELILSTAFYLLADDGLPNGVTSIFEDFKACYDVQKLMLMQGVEVRTVENEDGSAFGISQTDPNEENERFLISRPSTNDSDRYLSEVMLAYHHLNPCCSFEHMKAVQPWVITLCQALDTFVIAIVNGSRKTLRKKFEKDGVALANTSHGAKAK